MPGEADDRGGAGYCAEVLADAELAGLDEIVAVGGPVAVSGRDASNARAIRSQQLNNFAAFDFVTEMPRDDRFLAGVNFRTRLQRGNFGCALGAKLRELKLDGAADLSVLRERSNLGPNQIHPQPAAVTFNHGERQLHPALSIRLNKLRLVTVRIHARQAIPQLNGLNRLAGQLLRHHCR